MRNYLGSGEQLSLSAGENNVTKQTGEVGSTGERKEEQMGGEEQ